MVETLLLLALLVAGLASATNSTGQCFYPDGTLGEPFLHACGHPKDGHSACCHQGDYCMTNGLCWSGYLLYRTGCTDESWADPSCPTTCKNFGQGNMTQIISPWLVLPSSFTFCCGLLHLQNGVCFDNNGKEAKNGITIDTPFGIESFANDSYGNILPWLDMAGRHLPGSQPINAALGGDPASTATNSSVAGPIATTPPRMEPTSSGSVTSPNKDNCNSSSKDIGVGVALGCCLLAALIGNWWQWRRMKSVRARSIQSSEAAGVQSARLQSYAPSYYAGTARTPINEMHEDQRRVEIAGSGLVLELPGSAARRLQS